jgi:hypothetical protein
VHDAVLPASGAVEIGVAATPEELWRFVSDPSMPAKFSMELQEAHIEDSGVPELGAVIVGRNERGSNTWTTRSTIVECDEPHRFSWTTGGDEPGATWTFDVRAVSGGATLRHSVEFLAGGEPLTSAVEASPDRAAEIIDGRMAQVLESMSAVAEGIAALAETRQPG